MRFYASSIHDSDDAIKAVPGLNVVIHEEGPSTCGLQEEPKVGNCSSTKPLLTADFPAPLAPTTATRLTCDTVRFTSTIEEYTGSPRTSCAGRPCCGSSRPQGDQAPRRRIFIVPLLSKKCAFNTGYFSTKTVVILPLIPLIASASSPPPT